MRSLRFNAGLGLLLTAASVAGACSGNVAPAKGQLMVVLQSDMAIPKDFNRVQVQISVLGKLAFSNTYVADDAGSFTLPGTISVVAGEEAAQTVEVQVVGIDREGAAQTFSKVVTTLPRERIATLRVPLQWLCTGQVTEFGQGTEKQFVSKCAPKKGVDQSCVAGSCTDVNVDEAALPAFVPTEVFGGGEYANDPSGKCFDVQGCFKLGVDLAPDLDPQSPTYCQASLTVPQNYTANFAVNTGPKGAGVCDDTDAAAPCYVVLDQSKTFGWSALKSDQIDPAAADGSNVAPAQTGTGGAPNADAGAGAGKAGGASRAPQGGTGTGTGAAGAPASGGAAGLGEAPYIDSGNWHGHVFKAAGPGSVINLQNPSLMGFPICVNGFVEGAADSSNYAVVGFNLAQARNSPSIMEVSPSSQGGVNIEVTNNLGGELRAGIAGVNADQDPNASWCSILNPTGLLVPWTSFSSQCWTGTGAPYSPLEQPIASIEVTVPGGTGIRPFDFCIEDISEANIAARHQPPQQAQSLPGAPGVTPQQTGGGGDVSGSVVVQFPVAVCDKLLADPTLKLSATAACAAKTEATPICGPWSSVSTPHVPDPGGSLADEGLGGAGGENAGAAGADSSIAGSAPAAGGSSGAGTGGSGAGINTCTPSNHTDTTAAIASFDSDLPVGTIDSIDGRTGRVFSVSYGGCPATVINSVPGGANASLKSLEFKMPGSCTATPNAMVKLVVPLSATPGAGQSTIPQSICPYDAASYTGVSFWARGAGQTLKAALLDPSTLAATDPIPGGSCQSGCTPTLSDVMLSANWQHYTVLFAGAKLDPGQLLALQLQPTATSDIIFDIDDISFVGGAGQ